MRRVITTSLVGMRRKLWQPTFYIAPTHFFSTGPVTPHNVTERTGNKKEERVSSRRQQRGGNNNSNNNKSGPVKDRFPPVATDLSDPRRRLALLVDASSVDPRIFHNTILPAARKVGVPVLVRLFAVQLSSNWESFVAGNDTNNREDVDNNKTDVAVEELRHVDDNTTVVTSGMSICPSAEFFRVERFIPISMQMEADANHIFDFRRQNKIEAVCFVCSEVDRGLFEGFLSNIAGNGFNQYVLDDLGMAKEVLEDGRSADGSS